MLKIDQDKCTKCGVCSEVCPTMVILNEADGPRIIKPEACIVCGHCAAICPTAALDLDKAPLSMQTELENFPVLTSASAKSFLRSRRSVRVFKKEKVNKELLLELLDIARFAPSGGNTQGIAYHIYDNPELLQKITAATVDFLDEASKKGWGLYKNLVKVYRETGKDVVLRNAPHLIVAAAPNQLGGMGQESGHFALSYVELYATSLGLGSCWCGFVEGALQAGFEPLLELLNLPEEMKIAGALMVGYPKYKFFRLTDRNKLAVTWH